LKTMLTMTPKENLSRTSLNPLNSSLAEAKSREIITTNIFKKLDTGGRDTSSSLQTGRSSGVRFNVPLRLPLSTFNQACVIHIDM
jgi:hypothetical protein